jgi:hypothetical protein
MTSREHSPPESARMSRKDYSHMFRRLAFVLIWILSLLVPVMVEADASSASLPLLRAEQTVIARAFAPVFIFHPDEQYFPISSMFPMMLGTDLESDTVATSGAREQLGRAAERAARYAALTHETKMALAAVGYRVFTRLRHGESEVVVEYWCHYVYNAFTIRGTWLPYRISGNHPQDLERLFLVLSPVPGAPRPGDVPDEAWARRAFRIQRIVANAHDGSVPANEYEVKDDRGVDSPVSILVEKGSHAMAPDINHDGRFTPEVDSTRTRKLLWGIRDGGSTWGWFRSGQMDARDSDRSVRLCVRSASGETSGDNCRGYRLYQIEGVQRWFDTLKLTEDDRREVVGSTSLFTRTFSNVRVEELMVPHDPPDGRVLDRMLRRRPQSGQGLVAGFASLNNGPGFAVGPRLFRDIQSRRWPDVIVEGVALFPRGQNPAAKVSAFGSYAIDAMTNVLIGADWISRANPSADVVTAIEFHIGMIVVRPSWRLREGVFDSMVVAVF